MSQITKILLEARAARDAAKWPQALELYTKASFLQPQSWDIAHNRALCFLGAGHYLEAIDDAKKALSLNPALWQSGVVLGKSQAAIGLMAEADLSYELVLRSDPDNPVALLGRANLALNQFGDPSAASNLVEPLFANEDYRMDAELTQLMANLYERDSSTNATTMSARAKVFARRHLQLRHDAGIFSTATRKSTTQRPRVGLLSNAFCVSPVYFLTISGWDHVANGCDLVIFNRGHTRDWATDAFKNISSEWLEVQHMPGTQLAKVIADSAIDVLYDLGGWMDPVGLQALSLNPAPQQFKWVGGQSLTTGLDCFKGWIGDEMQSPKKLQSLYSEPLICVPGAYASYTPPSYLPKVAAVKSKTPCIFSNPAKISTEFLHYLKSIPGEKVFIHKQFRFKRVQERIRSALGVECEFICPSSHEDALKALNAHAVMIDTFPYTSGLTAYEASALGLEIKVTRVGSLFSERHTARYV